MAITNLVGNIINLLLRIPGVIFVFSFKGFFQSYVATKLGDPTPRNAGRLTINPAAHIDPIGFIFLLVFRFGWTKPIPVRTRNFKKIKRDTGIYYASGPLGCILGGFIMAFFASLTFKLMTVLSINLDAINIIYLIFNYASLICVSLGVFYLLPLPGLDGYNFITNFVPYKYYKQLYTIEKYSLYIFIGFILLLNTGVGSLILGIPISLIMNAFGLILGLIF